MQKISPDKYFPENILVVGGGLAGCYTALFAARQKVMINGNPQPRYNVTLIESEDQILNGSSVIAARMHLGGEYPKDLESGKACLQGAVINNLVWGKLAYKNSTAPNSTIYTTQPPMRFAIAEETQNSGRLTLDEFNIHYKAIRKNYAELLNKVRKAKRCTLNEAENALFGSAKPGQFFRRLTASEISIYNDPKYGKPEEGKAIIGGFQTQEPGLNMPLYLDALARMLEKEKVEIVTQCKINTVNKDESGRITGVLFQGRNKKTGIMTEYYRQPAQVVISAFDQGPEVEKILGTEISVKPAVYRRGMLIVNTLGFSRSQYPPTFFMDPGEKNKDCAENAGMWCPYSDHCAAVYYPPKAYLGTKKVTPGNTGKNDGWDSFKEIDPREYAQEYLHAVTPLLRFLKNTGHEETDDYIKAENVVIKNTVSFDAVMERRRHKPVIEKAGVPNCLIVYPTKATLTAQSAIEAVETIRKNSDRNRRISEADCHKVRDPLNAALSGDYSIDSLVSLNPESAEIFAVAHKIPPDILLQGRGGRDQPKTTSPEAAKTSAQEKYAEPGSGFGRAADGRPYQVSLFRKADKGATTGELLSRDFCAEIATWAAVKSDHREITELLTDTQRREEFSTAVYNRLLHLDTLALAKLMPQIFSYMGDQRRILFGAENIARVPREVLQNLADSCHDRKPPLPPSLEPADLSRYFERFLSDHHISEQPKDGRRRINQQLAPDARMEIATILMPLLFGALPDKERREIAATLSHILHSIGKDKDFFAPLSDPNMNKIIVQRGNDKTDIIWNDGRSIRIECKPEASSAKASGIRFQGKFFRPVQFHFHRLKNVTPEGKLVDDVRDIKGGSLGNLEYRFYDTEPASDIINQPVGELHAIYRHPDSNSELVLCAHVITGPQMLKNAAFDLYLEELKKLRRNASLRKGKEHGFVPENLAFDPLACFNSGTFESDLPYGVGLPEAPFVSPAVGGLRYAENLKLSPGSNKSLYGGVHAVHLPQPVTISLEQLETLQKLQEQPHPVMTPTAVISRAATASKALRA